MLAGVFHIRVIINSVHSVRSRARLGHFLSDPGRAILFLAQVGPDASFDVQVGSGYTKFGPGRVTQNSRPAAQISGWA